MPNPGIRKVKQFNICITNCFITIQNRVDFDDFVSNFKQIKLLNQKNFLYIFKVKAVQNFFSDSALEGSYFATAHKSTIYQ